MPHSTRASVSLCLLIVALGALAHVDALAASPSIEREIFHQPARGRIGEPLLFFATGLTPPVEVLFSDGSAPGVAGADVQVDVDRGVVLVRVPVGAQTGDMKIRANGADSGLFFFRVDPAPFTQGSDVVGGTVEDGASAPQPGTILILLASACNSSTLVDYAVADAGGHYAMHGPDGSFSILTFLPRLSGLANVSAPATLSSVPAVADFAAGAGTTVTGKIVDPNAPAGIAGARVSFDFTGGGLNHDEAITDGSGAYAVHLGAGGWRLEVEPPAGDPHASGSTMASIGGPSQILPDIALAAGVSITGFLRSATGSQPLSGVELTAEITNPCCTEVDRKHTRGDGAFSFTVAPQMAYQVHSLFDTFAPFADVKSGDVIVGSTSVAMDFVAQDAGFISGQVSLAGTGTPIGALQVEAALPSGLNTASATTCGDGTYRLRVVPDAAGYRVGTEGFDADPGVFPFALQTWSGAPGGTYFPCEGLLVPVPAAGGEATGIDFPLHPSATLSGVVGTSGGGCGDDLGLPASLTIDDGSSHACGFGRPDPNAPSGYRILGLPPSTVIPSMRMCVLNESGFEPQCFDTKIPPDFDPIVIGPGDVLAGVNLCLSPCATKTWFRDLDQDGHGDPNTSQSSCAQPPGFVLIGDDCDDAVAAVHPGAVEICNAVDDNCNGQTDEGNPGGGGACATGQSGVCSAGTQTCQGGSVQCLRNTGPSTEICDNLDNDCNGQVDDGNPGGGAACATGQKGVCAAGTQTCQGGTVQCVRDTNPSAEICDNKDNDCDGTVDGFATSCGMGPCARTGTCTAGVDSCHPRAPLPETCNGIDDNCDGIIDNGFPTEGDECATGNMGPCALGHVICSSGAIFCQQVTQPTAETCNDIDDDCNGMVDDIFPFPPPACDTGLLGVCAVGGLGCGPNHEIFCYQHFTPSVEICDNKDNDCDGTVDNFATGCGVGACRRTGSCVAGVIACAPGAPAAEICNGLDDDCNGAIDNVAGGCSLFVTAPQNAAVLDCTAPATMQPMITWNKDRYDTFKIFVSTDPAFPATKRITSGTKALTTASWHVTPKAWTAICKKAVDGGAMYLRIQGVDKGAIKGDPLKKFTSPVVSMTVDK